MELPKEMTTRKQIYLAGALFSRAEKVFNRGVATAIESNTDYRVYLPQNEPFTPEPLTSDHFPKTMIGRPRTARTELFEKLLSEIEQSSMVIAVCDGVMLDDGTAAEISHAYNHDIPVIALRTDSRSDVADTGPFNLMIWGMASVFVISEDYWFDQLIEAIKSVEAYNQNPRLAT